MYSRATTSAMADLCLPAGFFPAALVDISGVELGSARSRLSCCM